MTPSPSHEQTLRTFQIRVFPRRRLSVLFRLGAFGRFDPDSSCPSDLESFGRRYFGDREDSQYSRLFVLPMSKSKEYTLSTCASLRREWRVLHSVVTNQRKQHGGPAPTNPGRRMPGFRQTRRLGGREGGEDQKQPQQHRVHVGRQ